MADGDTTASLVVGQALSWVGTPYRHQASVKGVGCDCLGLVRGIWRELYGFEPAPLPIYSPNWAERGQAELLFDAAQKYLTPSIRPTAGSVILFRMTAESPVKHCGIMINNSEFIHAYWSRKVCRSAYGRWWQKRLAGVYQFPK
ncbi:MAG: C40 family peptidase [Robiginitomaculum sp.]|nr:C40 family peptidase [Robiginitomaculum sp.]